MNIALISLNKYGDVIGEKINGVIPVNIFSKSKIKNFKITKLAEELMKNYDAIIFISSTGIAVRAIAPFIKNKTKDPAVIVVDILGKYVISLLSGHLGGANEFSKKIAEIINAEAVITTATDNLNLESPDIIAKENKLIIDNMKKAKCISALMVNGENIGFKDEENLIQLPRGYTTDLEIARGIVYVTNKLNYLKGYDNTVKLKLIRKNIIIGIGCRKNYSAETMKGIVREKLKEHNIDERAVKIVASSSVKSEEKAIVELREFLGAQFRTFSNEDIKTVQYKYRGSKFVEEHIGVKAVCEPCVELSGGKILVSKLNLSGMTLCIGVEVIHNSQ
ncbi:cobalt-precorrin 5A hydrolase [Clostridium kluyveri]|uniref:Cobalamin biosynthesis protein CbiG n=1 Tax=Clostridium kluyveri TaxID=1534 RepID=A0A1L5F510_CLOKL|nr:cobalt-precorrin 5A hydrolase [Clostridium kluyveri]APM38099.1 cobalamin biosynthesis protein CbiG [Clostridium kluyveri]